ncbi:translation factor SUA5, partial [human gut metagenome]
VIVDKAIINDISEGQRALSPGMKYKHYSPKANIVIVEGDIENFCRFVSENNKNGNYCLISDEDVKYDIPCRCLTYRKKQSAAGA